MNNNTSGVSENRPMSGLSLNSGSSFRRSLGMGVPSVPSTPVLSTIFSATIIVNKDNAGYGMKVSGDKPVYVQSVKDGGAAQRAGLHSGDKIIKVNGVDVTQSTHTEVVALIKANAQVVLTVQQRQACGDMCPSRGLQPVVLSPSNNSNIVSSGRAGITAPRPVDNEKMRQLELQRVQTLRLMLEDEQKHLTAMRSKAGKRQEIQRAEARVHTLQEQLKALDAEGCPAASSHNVIQSDHTTTSHFNPHFLSRFPRSLSNLSLGGRAKKPEKDSPTDANRNKPEKNAKNHQMQQDKRCLVDEKCDERESRASLIIDAPPPLPQRNKNMVGWLQEQTSVDHSTDLDHSTDDGMKQILHSFLDHERNAFRVSDNNKSDANNVNNAHNAPPPLPPRQDRPLPNSIDTIMNYPLVSTCAPTLCNNNANPALQGKSLTPSHKRVQSSPDPLTSDSNFAADRQTKSSSGSWGNTEATPPGTPPPPYPSPTNADEENADGWNRLHSCSPITSNSNELHNRSNTLTYTSSDPIQAAQSIVAQQHIISMEDEELSDTEVPVEEHGPFKSLRLLLEHPGHVAVFLNYLFTNAQPTSLLFYLITDLYREGNLKDMRRWAYEIHSTFLVPGAPLHLNNVDETMAREIDDVLLYESDKEEILRKIFLRARTRAKEELTSQLNDFQVTRTVGLGMLFGPNDISLDVAIGDRAKEIRVIEAALLSNMESYVDDLDPNKEKLDCKRHATAQALATVLLRWFRISLGSHSVFSSFLERCPTFVSKEKTFRGKLIGKSRKLVVREHHLLSRQYYIVTHCNQCHDIIWGVGPQGYHCSDCGLNIHRGCSKVLEEDCPGPPINPNSKSKQNQSDRRISKLMEKIRPNHHFNSSEKQRLQEEESVDDSSTNNERLSTSAISNRSTPHRGTSFSTPEKGDGLDDSHRLGDTEQENESVKPKSAPVSVNRSESYKERLSQRRNMNQRRKTSDPNLSKTIDDTRDHNISHTTSSTSSSTSSLSSRSLDSPSISLEAVHGGGSGTTAAGYGGSMPGGSHSSGLQGADSDEGEDRRDWTIQVPPEILATLTDKDKKCQEVINELILTERSHIRTLSLLDRLFRAPLQSNAILPPEQFQLLFPASLRRLQEWHGLLGQRLRHWRKQAGPVSAGIGDLLLGMFDGPSGEELKQAAASFCEHQQIALEGLKERRRKEPRLHQLLNEAESNPACRRLQLKDLLPMACFMRLTKYPLLFENLLKCIEEDNPELQNIKKAMDLSKAILNHVNNAVREAENVHKLQLIQKKLDKSGYDKFADQYQQVSDYKNLDLTHYRIIHDGTLILRQQKSELPLYAILLDGLLVLLLRQDEKYILKFHQSTGSSESGRPDRASPIIKLTTAIVRPLASAKNTFFVIVTSQNSQMYEFATHSEKEYNLWYKLISDCISAVEVPHKVRPKFPFELHSDNHEADPVVPETTPPNEPPAHDCNNDCNYSSSDLGRLPEESETDSIEADNNTSNEADLQECKQDAEPKEKDTKNGENIIRQNPIFNMRIVTQSNNLICPNQVKISSVSEIHAAEPVLTVFEQLRRADTAIHEALTWKQKLVGQILGIPEEHYAVIADMAPMSGVQEVGEVLLTAIQQAQQLAQLLADSTELTEEQIMLAQLNRNKKHIADYCDSCNRNKTTNETKTSNKDLSTTLDESLDDTETSNVGEINKSKEEIPSEDFVNLNTIPFSDCKTCSVSKQWIPSVPADKLSELVNAVIPTLTYLLELFKGHDKDREALRKELQRQRELMHHMISQNSQEKNCFEKENEKTE